MPKIMITNPKNVPPEHREAFIGALVPALRCIGNFKDAKTGKEVLIPENGCYYATSSMDLLAALYMKSEAAGDWLLKFGKRDLESNYSLVFMPEEVEIVREDDEPDKIPPRRYGENYLKFPDDHDQSWN